MYVPGFSSIPGRQPILSDTLFRQADTKVCATCLATNQTGSTVVIGYSDDSLVLHDLRSGYKDRIRLEVGGHSNTVRTIVLGQQDGSDFLCLTGGSDCKVKLWDLRQRKCIRDYGDDDGDMPMDLCKFHTSSVRTIEATSSFESCFSGGQDGSIYHTDLVADSHTLLYKGGKNPITNLTFDEQNDRLWFSSAKDSSLRCLDLTVRSL